MILGLIYTSFLFNISTAQEFVIDKVDALIQRECTDCPGYLGEAYFVTPVNEASGYKAKDLTINGCHFTLISDDTVLVAAHCARPWINADWKTLSKNDCSKMAGFYFPKTAQFPLETARCKELVSPVHLLSGVQQSEPDHLFIKLDRKIQRPFTTATSDQTLSADISYVIWGYDSELKAFAKRSCKTLPAPSILTPMSYNNSGAYVTLTCDGNIEPGWSGAGVYDDKEQIVGLVSFGFETYTSGISIFGLNEVNISLARCFNDNETCFVNKEIQLQYLIQTYILAIDKAFIWQKNSIAALEKTISDVRFEYAPYRETPEDLFYKPAFKAVCRRSKSTQGVLWAVGDMTTLKPKMFLLNADTTIQGIIETAVNGSGGSFYLGFNFIRGDITSLPECELN